MTQDVDRFGGYL